MKRGLTLVQKLQRADNVFIFGRAVNHFVKNKIVKAKPLSETEQAFGLMKRWSDLK